MMCDVVVKVVKVDRGCCDCDLEGPPRFDTILPHSSEATNAYNGITKIVAKDMLRNASIMTQRGLAPSRLGASQ